MDAIHLIMHIRCSKGDGMAQPDYDLDLLRQEFAPSGTLRCALNHGNVVLEYAEALRTTLRAGCRSGLGAGTGPAARSPYRIFGITIRRKRCPTVLDPTNGTSAFWPLTPNGPSKLRIAIHRSLIEGAYLLRRGSAALTPSDVDRQQLKIGVVKGSAYELHLTRTGQGGKLIRLLQLWRCGFVSRCR